MRKNRDIAVSYVFGSEKGYVNRPDTDAGGPTNMGITQKTLSAWRGYKVTVEEVKQLTRKEAYDIYASEYWTPIRGDYLPSGLDYAMFDSCVTSGPNRTTRMLQTVLVNAGLRNADGSAIAIDGIMGAQTLDAVSRYPGGIVELIRAFCAERMRYLRSLKGKRGFESNGRGWTIRVTGIDPKGQWKSVPGVIGTAIKMARDVAQAPIPLPDLPPAVQDSAGAKTDDSSRITVTEVLKKPEGIGGLIVSVTGLVSAVQGNTILSYALGGAIVGGVIMAGVYFYRRLKSANV